MPTPNLAAAHHAVNNIGCVDLLRAMEERWSAPGCRGVAHELLLAARLWLNGDPISHPVVTAAFELVSARERAEKQARLAAAGSAA